MKTKQYLKSTLMVKNTLLILAFAVLIFGNTGCKNKKKITDNPKQKEDVVVVDQQLVKAKSTLQALIDDEGSKSITEKEKILADIKALNLNDPELNEMIKKVEGSIANQKEAIRKAEEDAKPENILQKYFDGIANSGNDAEAKDLIQKALQMFSSDNANVLIIIHKEANMNDYDEPTTILKYLNYLKDKKKNLNNVEKIHYDANNKIKTLELIKK
jgi:hypothetical protein